MEGSVQLQATATSPRREQNPYPLYTRSGLDTVESRTQITRLSIALTVPNEPFLVVGSYGELLKLTVERDVLCHKIGFCAKHCFSIAKSVWF
jgi:hypothetical protein